ncbi:MAG: sigma-70 family RNA polymerase sigma factor [Elusimicrobiota bacterium]
MADERSDGLKVSGPEDIGLVYDRFFRRVYNYVRYRVNDRETADDLTAQVFEKVLAKIGGYKPGRGPFEAWLFAIARNAINDHFRDAGWKRWFSLDLAAERPSKEPTPEEALVRDEDRGRVAAALSKLDGRERDLLGLKFGAGFGNREIAVMEGLTESNVGVILFRALRKLKADLQGEAA